MKINVNYVARLANLPLSQEEEKKFETQLSSILEYIEKLNEKDTKGTEITSQITGLENTTREDKEALSSLTQDEALSNSKSNHNGMFKVKKVL